MTKIGQIEITEGKKKGHGIGIYSAIQLIKAWHGKYDIETKLGVGTRFTIYLPIAI